MANKIEIIIDGVDKASAVTNKISSAMKGLATVTTGVNSAMMIGQQVFSTMSKVFDVTVNAAQEYNQQVKDMMLSTGGTAEETSKLIQVVDDVGISYGTLETAMKMASKKGIEPNIQSLASLSDQYLKLAPGVERNQFLMDSFGRSGLDMARAMDLGGAALRKMGDDMKGGLVLTDENIKASEEYRQNLDELSDSASGLATTIGNKTIPVLNDMIQVMQADIKMIESMGTFWEDLNQIMEDFEPGADRAAAVMRLLGDSAAEAINENLPSFMERTADATDSATNSYIAMAEAMQVTANETITLNEAMKAASDANQGLLSLTMTIQSELDGWREKTAELSAEQVTLEATLAALGVRTAANAVEWDKTTAAINANSVAAQNLAIEHDKAMKKIAADLFIAKLSVDGLTDAEYDLAIQALITSGQIDQATADMARNFENEVAEAVRVAKDEVVVLGKRADGLAKDYFMNFTANLTVKTNYTGSGGGGTNTVPRQTPTALGSNSVLPNQPRLVGERGAELFVPNTSGMIIPNNKLGGGSSAPVIIQLTYAPAFSMANEDEFQRVLLPFIRRGIRQATSA